jgi:hypothetical protein
MLTTDGVNVIWSAVAGKTRDTLSSMVLSDGDGQTVEGPVIACGVDNGKLTVCGQFDDVDVSRYSETHLVSSGGVVIDVSPFDNSATAGATSCIATVEIQLNAQ